ncbi:MAG: 6-phosphofructokinase, partial [Eubacteriales bacterium]
LELAVKAEIGCKVRSIELNLPQRCAAHIASAQDLSESVCVGKAAVKAAAEGLSREMMLIVRGEGEEYSYTIGHSDVSAIANKIKTVFPEFINDAGNDVTDECCRYLLPLIAGEASPEYYQGIPDFLVI